MFNFETMLYVSFNDVAFPASLLTVFFMSVVIIPIASMLMSHFEGTIVNEVMIKLVQPPVGWLGLVFHV